MTTPKFQRKELSRKLRQPLNRLYAEFRMKQFHSRPRTLEEVVHWSMHFGGGGYMRIKTQQIPWEILQLAKTVEAVKPKTILEIGTAWGGTLLIWSHLASERIVTCDLNDMHRQQPVFRKLVPPASKCEIAMLTGNSHEASFKAKVARQLGGKPVDFLFIDGDHTETGVEADFNDYVEFVRPGGIVAFHDIVEAQPRPTNQVYHFWRRLKQHYHHEEFVADPQQRGFGIGVIHLP